MSVSLRYTIGFPNNVSASIAADGALEVASPPFPGAAQWDFRYAQERDSTRSTIYPMELQGNPSGGQAVEGGYVFLPDERTLYMQIRPRADDGQVGAWGNVFVVTTPQVVHLAFKDLKKIAVPKTTNETQPAACSLTTMTDRGTVGQTNTGLVFAAGDLLHIVAVGYRSSPSSTASIVDRGAATGWDESSFHGGILGRSGNDAHGIRSIFKIADGTENLVVPLLFTAGTGSKDNYAQYYAMSYSVAGVPVAYHAEGNTTSNTPPAIQAVPAAGLQQDPLIVYSVAVSKSLFADNQAFSETPEIIEAIHGGTVGFSSRLKIKLFDVDSNFNSVTTSMIDLGALNSIAAGAIILEQE